MSVIITEEMRQAAAAEAQRRDPNIRHHFELNYMSGRERDVIGFLGEFACRQYMGLDWRRGIRENYDTIDSGDILLPGNKTIDVKTETMPFDVLMRLVKGQVDDDAPYGRRLINAEQIPLLEHYDYVVWGAFPREKNERWYALGYLETKYILEHYQATTETPFGSSYPEPCLNIRTSELKNLRRLTRV